MSLQPFSFRALLLFPIFFLISFVTDKRIGTKSIENTLVVFFLICRPSAQKKSDQYSFQLLGDCQRGVLISKKVLFSNLISHEIININIYEFYIMEMVVFYMSYCITLNLRGLSKKKKVNVSRSFASLWGNT